MWRVLALLVGVAPVWADTSLAKVEKITAPELPKVKMIVAQQQRNFRDACETVKVIRATALSVAEPVVVDAAGKVVKGSWRVRYAVDVCGEAGLRTVEMVAGNSGLALEPLVPGATLADKRLQEDIQRSFRMAGNVAMPQCTELPVIRDTRVTIYPAKPNERWQELWIGRMCERDLGQVVEFLPTKAGTTFKMSLPAPVRK